jgi:hypothetical protein
VLTELKETHILTFIKDIRRDTDEEVHRVRYVIRGVELLCPLHVCHLPGTSTCSAIWIQKSFRFLWRLHCKGMIVNRVGWGNSAKFIYSDSSWPFSAAFLPSGYGAGTLWNEEGLTTYSSTRYVRELRYNQLKTVKIRVSMVLE